MSRHDNAIYIIVIKRLPDDEIKVVKWTRSDIVVRVESSEGDNDESVTMYSIKERDGAKRLIVYRGGSRPKGLSITMYVPERFERNWNRESFTLMRM